MEMNGVPTLDGDNSNIIDPPQAASSASQVDNGGGFLEHWGLDPNGLEPFQDANNGIVGDERGWHWGSLEDFEVEDQLMVEQASRPPETPRPSHQVVDKPITNGREQIFGTVGVVSDPVWEHLPLTLSDHDLKKLDSDVLAPNLPQPPQGPSIVGLNETDLASPASSQTVTGDNSVLEKCQNLSLHTANHELANQSPQTGEPNQRNDENKRQNDGGSFIGSASGLIRSLVSSKAPTSGTTRLRVPLDWTPPKFLRLPPKPMKRKLSTVSKSLVKLSEQTTKRPRTTDQTVNVRMATNTIQPHGTRNMGLSASRNASDTSKENHGASRPRPAPIVTTTPNHSASTVTEANKATGQLPTPKSATSVKGLNAATKTPAFASPSASKVRHHKESSRNNTGKAANRPGQARAGDWTSTKSSDGQHAFTGFTVSDAILLSDDEEPITKPSQPVCTLKRRPEMIESRESRRDSELSRHLVQASKDCRERVQVGSTQKQDESTYHLTLPRFGAPPSQTSLSTITTHIGAKGTSKPNDLVGFRGSRPITTPTSTTAQSVPREKLVPPMSKAAALMILQKTARSVPNRNDFTSQLRKDRKAVEGMMAYRSEQSWHESRDKQAIHDRNKSQKRQQKFRQDIISAHPDLPEEELQRRVDDKEKDRRRELLQRKEQRDLKKAYRNRPGELEHDVDAELSDELSAIRRLQLPTKPLCGIGPARVIYAYRVLKTHPYIDDEEIEDQFIEVRTFLEKEEANNYAQKVFLNENDPILREAGEGSQLKQMTMLFDDEREGLFEGERVFTNGKKHSVIVDHVQMQAGNINSSMHRGKKLSKQAKAAFTPVQFVVWAVFTIDQRAQKCDNASRRPSYRPPSKEMISLLGANDIGDSEKKVLSSLVSPLPNSLYSDYVADKEDQAAEEEGQDGEELFAVNITKAADLENEHIIDDSDSESGDDAHDRTINDSTATTKDFDAKTSDGPTVQPEENGDCQTGEETLEMEEGESEEDEEDLSTENVNYHHEMVASFTNLRAANIEAYRILLQMQTLLSLNSCVHPTCTCRRGGLSEFLRDHEINPIAEAIKNDIDLSRPNIGYSFNNDPVYRLPLGFRHLQIFVKRTELIGPVPIGEGLIDNTEELEEEVIEEREERERVLQRQKAREETRKEQERKRQMFEIQKREKAITQELSAPQNGVNHQQAEQCDSVVSDISKQEEQQRFLERELQNTDLGRNEDSDISEEE